MSFLQSAKGSPVSPVFDRSKPTCERLAGLNELRSDALTAGWFQAAENLISIDTARLVATGFPLTKAGRVRTEIEQWLAQSQEARELTARSHAASDAARALLLEYESRRYRVGLQPDSAVREFEWRLLLTDLFNSREWELPPTLDSHQPLLFSRWISGLVMLDLSGQSVQRVVSLHEYLEGDQLSPGSGTVVIMGGEIAEVRTFGYSDLAQESPVDPERTLFDLGSLSKMFTGLAVLLLSASGRLPLDAPVRRFLSELPWQFDEISVDDLVRHHSGLIDDHEILEQYEVTARGSDNRKILETCLQYWNLSSPVRFSPGSSYQYANLNYILLAEVVARVSCQPFREFLRTELFEPAGMKATLLADSDYVPVSGGGYTFDGDLYIPALNATVSAGDGRVFSTLSDMARCHQYVRKDGLSRLLEAAQASSACLGTRYAAGLRLDPRSGIFGHAGWDAHGTGIQLFLPEPRPFSMIYLSKATARKHSNQGLLNDESQSIGKAIVTGWCGLDISSALVDY